MKIPTDMPPIVVDTREPTHTAYKFDGCTTVRAKLDTGDYSIQGLERWVAVERKVLGDFVACCTHERDRFFRELERMAPFTVRGVVVEADFATLLAGAYRSAASGNAVAATVLAIQTDFGIPVLLAGEGREGERSTLWILRRAWAKRVELGLDPVRIELGQRTTTMIEDAVKSAITFCGMDAGFRGALPCDLEAEGSILSEMLDGRPAPEGLRVGHFFSRLNGVIFGAIESIRESGGTAKPDLVMRLAMSLGYSGESFEADLAALARRPVCTHVDRAAERVIAMAGRREAIRHIQGLEIRLRDSGSDDGEIHEALERVVAGLQHGGKVVERDAAA